MIVDRIEGKYAVCESADGTPVLLPVEDLPEDAGEGAVLHWQENKWVKNASEENERREKAEALMDALFEEEETEEDAQ